MDGGIKGYVGGKVRRALKLPPVYHQYVLYLLCDRGSRRMEMWTYHHSIYNHHLSSTLPPTRICCHFLARSLRPAGLLLVESVLTVDLGVLLLRRRDSRLDEVC